MSVYSTFHSHELLKSEKLSLVVSLLLFCSGLRKYAAIEFWRSLALQRGPGGSCPPKILVGWATMHLAPPIIGLHFRYF